MYTYIYVNVYTYVYFHINVYISNLCLCCAVLSHFSHV